MSSQPILRPFAGLRPAPQHAADVAAPPYDVVSTAEARALARDRPLSFLHVSKPEIDLDEGTDPFSPAVYAKGAENLARMVGDGVLMRDAAPCNYVYRMKMGARVQTGIVGGVRHVQALGDGLTATACAAAACLIAQDAQ